MAVAKMNRISAAGFKDSRDDFLKELMTFGFVEVSAYDPEDLFSERLSVDTAPDISVKYDKLALSCEDAINSLYKYANAKSPFLGSKREISNSVFNSVMKDESVEETVNVINTLTVNIAAAENEINRLSALVAGLKPWEKLNVDFNLEGTKNTSFILGTIPSKNEFPNVIADLNANLPSAVVSSVSEDKNFRYVSCFCFKEDKEQLLEILRNHSFTPINKGSEEGTAAQIIAEYEKTISDNKVIIEESINKIKQLADKKDSIEVLYDVCLTTSDRFKSVTNMIGTGNVFYFEGWLPVSAKEKTEKLFEKYGYYYEMREPEDEEEPPVLLQNSSIVTPFESITELYSLPSPREIDPTPFFAIFYFIFFGLMLSDAGYGALLFVICFVALKKFRLQGLIKKLVKLLMYCGISTMIWGILFGGVFGDFVQVFNRTILGREFALEPIWFNPVQEPMTLLILALIMGAIHIFVGMGLQAYKLIKSGKVLDAIFDIFFWYALLIGLVLFAVGGSLAPAASDIGKWMAIVGGVGILITGGRDKKGFGKITGGLGSLYGITGYLSDVLSYSRLLALGLATGVVAQVINTLGSLAGGGAKGLILLIVVFIIGTVFNLLINVLGSFVHTSRLQYVEFFGKFFEGGGTAFKPFKRNTKYVDIIEEDK